MDSTLRNISQLFHNDFHLHLAYKNISQKILEHYPMDLPVKKLFPIGVSTIFIWIQHWKILPQGYSNDFQMNLSWIKIRSNFAMIFIGIYLSKILLNGFASFFPWIHHKKIFSNDFLMMPIWIHHGKIFVSGFLMIFIWIYPWKYFRALS